MDEVKAKEIIKDWDGQSLYHKYSQEKGEAQGYLEGIWKAKGLEDALLNTLSCIDDTIDHEKDDKNQCVDELCGVHIVNLREALAKWREVK